jgi:hypothetical protein
MLPGADLPRSCVKNPVISRSLAGMIQSDQNLLPKLGQFPKGRGVLILESSLMLQRCQPQFVRKPRSIGREHGEMLAPSDKSLSMIQFPCDKGTGQTVTRALKVA